MLTMDHQIRKNRLTFVKCPTSKPLRVLGSTSILKRSKIIERCATTLNLTSNPWKNSDNPWRTQRIIRSLMKNPNRILHISSSLMKRSASISLKFPIKSWVSRARPWSRRSKSSQTRIMSRQLRMRLWASIRRKILLVERKMRTRKTRNANLKSRS